MNKHSPRANWQLISQFMDSFDRSARTEVREQASNLCGGTRGGVVKERMSAYMLNMFGYV